MAPFVMLLKWKHETLPWIFFLYKNHSLCVIIYLNPCLSSVSTLFSINIKPGLSISSSLVLKTFWPTVPQIKYRSRNGDFALAHTNSVRGETDALWALVRITRLKCTFEPTPPTPPHPTLHMLLGFPVPFRPTLQNSSHSYRSRVQLAQLTAPAAFQPSFLIALPFPEREKSQGQRLSPQRSALRL